MCDPAVFGAVPDPATGPVAEMFNSVIRHFFFFFFQAEDGIRDTSVTGVQTCALPIYLFLVGSEALEPYPKPPKRKRLPSGLTQPSAPHREPGTFVAAALVVAFEMPCAPSTPFWSARLLPETHVHWPATGSYFQRSLRTDPI